ncbi:MAG: hypothetical protein WBF93_15295, partial [Pirellulales bacterium]
MPSFNSVRERVARWLAVGSVAILIYTFIPLGLAWLRAWQQDAPPFRPYSGLDGPWDHNYALEIPLHSAMNAPALALFVAIASVLIKATVGRVYLCG